MIVKTNKHKLLQYMKENNLSKKEFCKICHIGYSSLNNILSSNIKHIGIDRFIKICIATKLKYSDIVIENK